MFGGQTKTAVSHRVCGVFGDLVHRSRASPHAEETVFGIKSEELLLSCLVVSSQDSTGTLSGPHPKVNVTSILQPERHRQTCCQRLVGNARGARDPPVLGLESGYQDSKG